MNIVEIIEKKRDGQELPPAEIEEIISRYTHGNVPDYQMSAFLMAVYFQGMSEAETAVLTRAMIDSGTTVDLSGISGFCVDKHSTGGVGDKISLILAPLAAAAGVPVPMMAGRGLGHTGGTLDKLESIPGFRTDLGQDEFRRVIREAGFSIIGQSASIVPADRKMYAMRDVTGCVPSIPLICSSIISKKKAEGTGGLVLDVKTGRGAFLPDREKTVELAEKLVGLGNSLGIKTVAQLTGMDEPLGRCVGNWLEVRETLDCLQGKGPADVMAVVLQLGALMLVLGGRADSVEQGRQKIQQAVDSGRGMERFCRMVEMQGGGLSVIRQPETYPDAAYRYEVVSEKSGYIAAVDAREIGLTAVLLGAGRMKKEDSVDPSAGIVLHAARGGYTAAGDLLAELYTGVNDSDNAFAGRVLKAVTITENKPSPVRLIDELIDPAGLIPA